MRPSGIHGSQAKAQAEVEARRRSSSPPLQPPALSRRARLLIARIRRSSSDVQAVHELERHYADVGDQDSLANLLEGWAQTLGDDRAAADTLIRAASALPLGPGSPARSCLCLAQALAREASDRRAAISSGGERLDLAKRPA